MNENYKEVTEYEDIRYVNVGEKIYFYKKEDKWFYVYKSNTLGPFKKDFFKDDTADKRAYSVSSYIIKRCYVLPEPSSANKIPTYYFSYVDDNNRKRIIIDDKEFYDFDEFILEKSCVFKNSYMFTLKRNGMFYVIVDGRKEGPYEGISDRVYNFISNTSDYVYDKTLGFTDDLKHYFYVVERQQGEKFYVIDGKPQKYRFKEVSNIVFVGNRYFYKGYLNLLGRPQVCFIEERYSCDVMNQSSSHPQQLIYGDRVTAIFDEIQHIKISIDGRKFYFFGRDGARWYFVLNGKVVKKLKGVMKVRESLAKVKNFPGASEKYVWKWDGRIVTVLDSFEEESCIVYNDRILRCPKTHIKDMELCFDGKKYNISYVYLKKGKWFAKVLWKVYGPYNDIKDVDMTYDCKHYSIIFKSVNGNDRAIVDGHKTISYKNILSVYFSEKEEGFYIAITRGNKYYNIYYDIERGRVKRYIDTLNLVKRKLGISHGKKLYSFQEDNFEGNSIVDKLKGSQYYRENNRTWLRGSSNNYNKTSFVDFVNVYFKNKYKVISDAFVKFYSKKQGQTIARFQFLASNEKGVYKLTCSVK